MNEGMKPKYSNLNRMKSLSNILASTGDTAHQVKLYKKYRGELV